MNTTESPAPPLIQANNDFFHGSRDRVEASLPVALNIVLTLLDDVAVPAGTDRSARWVYRFYRYDSILFFDQGGDPLISLMSTPLYALRTLNSNPTAALTGNLCTNS